MTASQMNSETMSILVYSFTQVTLENVLILKVVAYYVDLTSSDFWKGFATNSATVFIIAKLLNEIPCGKFHVLEWVDKAQLAWKRQKAPLGIIIYKE